MQRSSPSPPPSPGPSDGGYLATKRVVPQLPPRLIDRARLLDQLDAAVSASPVTLLRAPAGSGKSALTSTWARSDRPPGPVAWLTLSSTDSHRGRFWRQVFLTLAETQASPAIAQLAVPSPAAVDVLLGSLLIALTELDAPVVLVLDDLHEIDDEEIMEDLRMLLRRPPAGLKLIISTRRDPPLRLQRLRLAGTLAELPEQDLHFTPEEAGSLLAVSGVQLDQDDTHRLWARTEGWAAGLALTAHALRRRDDTERFIDEFAGDVAPVADYLLEEVLAEQSPRVREFLLETSILNSVCGDLADAITRGTGSAVLLERLHHGGVLTTAMDDHREWYRYHGLLADLLRAVVRREQPQLVPVLHARAARWLADHGYPIAAARHAAAAGDLDHVAEIAASSAFALMLSGEVNELATVLGELPIGELHARPVLALTLAAAALEVGDTREVARWTAVAAARADQIPEHQRERFETALVLINLYRARYTGEVDTAIALARPIVAGVEQSPLHGTADIVGVVLLNLGALELWTGNLPAAGHELDRGVALAVAGGHRYLTVFGMAHQSVHRMWSGELLQAEQIARETLELAELHGWRGTARAAIAMLILSIGAALQGRLDESRALLDEVRTATANDSEQPLYAHTTMHAAHLRRLDGDPDGALTQIAELRLRLRGSAFLAPLEGILAMHEGLALLAAQRADAARAALEGLAGGASGEAAVALARLELALGNTGKALALAVAWTEPQAATKLPSTRVHAYLVIARAHFAQGEREPAAAALERALAMSERHVRRLPFIEQGSGFLPQLRAHITSGTAHRALVGEIEQIIEARRDAGARPAPAAVAALSEELSARELAVLRFLPTMLSNREIAEELIVSVNTVKTHLKQIYSKLDAHDRRDAVRRARDRGLL